jgi:hypothetical protein
VLIVCPSCRRSIRVVDLRPGRFNPRCPQCDRLFQITVPEEAGRSPVVSELEPSVFAEPVALDAADAVPLDIVPIAVSHGTLQPQGRDLRPGLLPQGTPRFLGGHMLLKLLGHGPRGQSFLAVPAGLYPLFVLKLLAADRSADPIFRAHFTREAFTAAMIEHPNLARLGGVGDDRGRAYASVQFTPGSSLAELISSGTRIEPYQAAMLILQAARGLWAAHQQGLWHRDVKPANLRLGVSGLVTVDDLGLEMTPSLALAMEPRRSDRKESAPVPAAVGSPAFMAPEQAHDPLTCDGRADIYALGCTFYNLVTGRPPFAGANAVELMRQHQEETPAPANDLAPGLPRGIADVIRTMMAKRLDERYPSMGVVVEALERTIGLKEPAATTPLAESGEVLHTLADGLASAPARRLRSRVLALAAAIWLAFVALLFRLGLVQPGVGILGLGALTGAITVLSSAIIQRSELFGLAVAVVLGRGFRAWLAAGLIAAGVLLAVVTWGGLQPWLLLICAGGAAAAFHYYLDRPWQVERRRLLTGAQETLKRLRARGHDEQNLRELVARQAGDHWEDLFEGLFGLGAVPIARSRWRSTEASRLRSPVRRLREFLCMGFQQQLEARLDRQQTRLLQQVEERRLEAQGVNLLTARRKSRRIAKAMVLTVADWRDQRRLLEASGQAAPADAPSLWERLSRAADAPELALEPHEPHASYLRRRLEGVGSLLLGGGLRLLLALALLIVLVIWLDARGILTFGQVRAQWTEIDHAVQDAMRASEIGRLRDVKWIIAPDWRRLEEPVDFAWVTDLVGNWVRGSNLAVAAALLLVSTFSGRRFVGLMALVGAAVALFGARWGLTLAILEPRFPAQAQARLLGLLILIAGMVLRRRRPAA